jgi:xylulokinase
LGIDIGTTGCKAVAYGEKGILTTAYREYPTLHPGPGLAELDPVQVGDAILAVIAECADATQADPIRALSAASMGEAMVPVDTSGEPLGRCILSSDPRGKEYVTELLSKIPMEELYPINPNIPGVNYSLPKLRWIQDNDPELYERTDTFLLWDGYLSVLLGGDPCTCYSLANRTLLFDIRGERWSEEILAATGIDGGKLPELRPSGTLCGTVSPEKARQIGLSDGVKIILGGHDQCCNALGAGIVEGGRAVCGIGTYECITPVYDRLPDLSAMAKTGLNVEHHVLPGLYASFLYNQGGALIRWFRDTFAGEMSGDDQYERLSDEMPDGPGSILVLPYFELTGSPGYIDDGAGMIAGLRMDTSRGEILKAVMEGETFYFVEGLEILKHLGIDTSEFVATGGGSRSDRWLQIKADILGVPFVRPRNPEAGTLGAAILAGTAAGQFSSTAEALEQFQGYRERFVPNQDNREQYASMYERYKRLYPAHKTIFGGSE